MGSLQGRVALVTGGGRGIGRAIALALARAGADVAVAARTVPEIEAVAAEIAALGRRTHFFPLDVSDARVCRRRRGRWRRGSAPSTCSSTTPASTAARRYSGSTMRSGTHPRREFHRAVRPPRACLPGMYERRFGRVINIASVAGKIGLKYGAAYSAAKHGLIGLTRSLALEGARKGVTANAICPSWTETRMMQEAAQDIAAATAGARTRCARRCCATTRSAARRCRRRSRRSRCCSRPTGEHRPGDPRRWRRGDGVRPRLQ